MPTTKETAALRDLAHRIFARGNTGRIIYAALATGRDDWLSAAVDDPDDPFSAELRADAQVISDFLAMIEAECPARTR